jgi:hypothetical protein
MPAITIDEIIDKLNEMFDKIQTKVEELRQKANAILSKVPGFLSWAVDKFLDAWNKMLEKLGEFWDWFADKLAYVGDPFALHDKAGDWHTLVGLPGKNEADLIDEQHELLVDETWNGTAASSYREKVPAQEAALRSLGSTFASTVASNLKTVAFGIAAFWIGVIAALVALVVAILSATAATGTIIGLPAVPFLVIAGILAFLLAAGAGLATLAFTSNQAAEGFRNVKMYATTWPVFAL